MLVKLFPLLIRSYFSYRSKNFRKSEVQYPISKQPAFYMVVTPLGKPRFLINYPIMKYKTRVPYQVLSKLVSNLKKLKSLLFCEFKPIHIDGAVIQN